MSLPSPTRGYSKKEKNDRFPTEELILITAREDSAITSRKITSHEEDGCLIHKSRLEVEGIAGLPPSAPRNHAGHDSSTMLDS